MSGMAAPFGKGTFSERQHAMARRMGTSADVYTVLVFLGCGGCLFTAARVKRRSSSATARASGRGSEGRCLVLGNAARRTVPEPDR